jgi:hypothetical protein
VTPTRVTDHSVPVDTYAVRLQLLRRAVFELLDDLPSLDTPVGPELPDAIQRAANELGFAELHLRQMHSPGVRFIDED